MKRLLAILVVATMLVSVFAMTPVLNAATADWVENSAEGTAVIDGEKDAAYDAANVLVLDQYGHGNGGGEVRATPAAHAYVINDSENVYIYVDVHDDDLDNASANNYEQDSVELFYMNGNQKTQWRIHYDGTLDNDSGDALALGENVAVVLTDGGYAVEAKIPITDVSNNQIEMLIQINDCTGGSRTGTVYVTGHPEGDDAWQRSNRQTEYDCWMTLQLVGEFENTRVDPEPEAEEITVKNYQSIASRAFGTSFFIQDQATWSYWNTLADGGSVGLGETLDIAVDFTLKVPADALTPELTNDYTTVPKFRMSFSDGAMVEGDKGEYSVSIGDIVITAEGYENVVIPAQDIDFKLECTMADWGLTGNAREIEMANDVIDQLGLTVEQFCTEYLPALTGLTTTFTYNSYNLNTKEVVDEFIAGLEALEQTFIDEKLKDYTDRVEAALEAAKGANGDAKVLADALDDATKATNRARTDCNNAGYTGIALDHVENVLAPKVAEIQALVDEAAAAAEPEVEDTPTEPESTEDKAPASSNTSSSGGSTGVVVGIIIAVVVVIVAVVAVVLGKKKK